VTPRPVSPPRVTGRAARAGARWAVLASLLAVAAVRIDWAGVVSALGSAAPGLMLVAAAANAASSVCKALTWQGLVDALPSARGRSRRSDMVCRCWRARWSTASASPASATSPRSRSLGGPSPGAGPTSPSPGSPAP
jgi:hypothetical protein